MRIDNFNLITDIYTSIKKQIAKEFAYYSPDDIEIPVDIDVIGNEIKVYFNIGTYEVRTEEPLGQNICEHISYIRDVNLTTTNRFAELVLTLTDRYS